MYLQLVEDTLTLQESNPEIHKIANMKVIAKVISVDKIVPPEQDQISISIELEIDHQLSYTSLASKNRIFVATYQKRKTIYLTGQELASDKSETDWNSVKFIEATATVQDIGSIVLNSKEIYSHTLLSIELYEVKPIIREEEVEDEWESAYEIDSR